MPPTRTRAGGRHGRRLALLEPDPPDRPFDPAQDVELPVVAAVVRTRPRLQDPVIDPEIPLLVAGEPPSLLSSRLLPLLLSLFCPVVPHELGLHPRLVLVVVTLEIAGDHTGGEGTFIHLIRVEDLSTL